MTTTTESLIDLAFANVYAAPRGAQIPGYDVSPDATADSFHVGQVVAIYSRGNDRLAVIEKIGKKNVTVLYVTDGGIKDAERTLQRQLAIKPDHHRSVAETNAARNWDYYTGDAPEWVTRPASYGASVAERKEQWEKKSAAFLAENPDRAAYIQAQGEEAYNKAVRDLDFARTRGVRAYVTVTRKSIPFANVGVKA